MDQARTLLSSTAVISNQTGGLLLPALQIWSSTVRVYRLENDYASSEHTGFCTWRWWSASWQGWIT